ncbi:hypothetical protein QNH46_06255 [Paenibacillus woosongensis]|uniref:Uncharacterized protein n=1 Tax=Paenibacillus woosongensis TaxID=307580 RepID=A0AA95I4A3_9BACL|nr:hypothetical protein [Paenibacillus woosongensis]WHX50264.1 hypothetical protein QNH46_06255 [Paenibacillus woosongensis]
MKRVRPIKKHVKQSARKHAKPVKIRSISGRHGSSISTTRRNEIALLSAILFLIAASLSLYVAWNDLQSGGTSETLI